MVGIFASFRAASHCKASSRPPAALTTQLAGHLKAASAARDSSTDRQATDSYEDLEYLGIGERFAADHRIPGWVSLEGTLMGHVAQTSHSGRVIPEHGAQG